MPLQIALLQLVDRILVLDVRSPKESTILCAEISMLTHKTH